MINFNELINILKTEKYIYIQTHDYPDHDAVASAYGLQKFLENFGIKSFLTFNGDIQRDSLVNMIDELNIDIKNINEYDMKKEDKIIIVDGCKGNKNVTDLIGDEVGVIDHHQVSKAEDVPFNDIRSNYGACSSIIYSYYVMFQKEINQNTATALLIGINMDTSLLTRGVCEEDIDAYSHLYTRANVRLVNSILRNYIQQKDLDFYKHAIENVEIQAQTAFCYFPEGCNQNMLGILGDFFLSLKEIEFVILCAKNNNKINFSLRNESPKWNCNLVIQEVLKGIGFGGGHIDMAGGLINDINLFDRDTIRNKFYNALK
jgi:nanoRNase/pAp phosphatase (c-di-AMP/oligoRNAs hydrolase)